ncbi:MAG: flippase [Thermoplasmatales archaeon]|nr:MAG: flippase [Thermoplasmatales archaeon]
MVDTESISDPQIVNRSLQKVAKGTGIVFIGSIFLLLFSFAEGVLIVRNWTQAEFGVISLGFAILAICTSISTLGMQQGVVRSIAYVRGKKDNKKISQIIYGSIVLSTIISIILAAIIFLLSDIIADVIFHEPSLGAPLKIFSIIIPFFAVIRILVSIFRGFDQVKPAVYFEYILIGLLFTISLIIIIFLDLPFIYIAYVYASTIIVTCVLFSIYAIKKLPSRIISDKKSIDKHVTKELVLFSLPLLTSILVTAVINKSDILLLGSLKTSADVGLYADARPLSGLISFFLNALMFMYMPVISGLYASGLIKEIKANYSIVTKWLSVFTLPLFLILFLFPEVILGFIYGDAYIFASNALRILCLGVIFHNFVGPCGATLVAMGKPRFIMYASIFAALSNVGLSVVLIPYFGVVGAATAFAGSLIASNIIKTWKIYSISGVHPISKNQLKTAISSVLIALFIYFILKNFLVFEFWMVPFMAIVFYITGFLSILFTKSLHQEDIDTLMIMGQKLGMNLSRTKRFLTKFI